MRKGITIKIFALLIFTIGILSCVSSGISFGRAKRIVVSPFADVKPPYVFTVERIRIINKDGFSTGEGFVRDFLTSNGYRYNFHFLFPENGEKNGDKKARYILDLFIKEKGFSDDLKDLTSISGTLHIYENNKLLYQVVFTEETTVSINSYHKLYRVIDEILGSLSRDLEKKQKEREKKKKA